MRLPSNSEINFEWHFLNPEYCRTKNKLDNPFFHIINDDGMIVCKIYNHRTFSIEYLKEPHKIKIDSDWLFNELLNKIKLEVVKNS